MDGRAPCLVFACHIWRLARVVPDCSQFAAKKLTGADRLLRWCEKAFVSMASKLGFNPLCIAATAVLAVTTAVAPASAVTVLTFTNQTPGTTNTEATASADGITVTASGPVGGPFPASGGINSITSGLCAFAQNNSDGNRCGFIATPANSTTSLTGFNLTFDTPVFITGFNIGLFDDINLNSGTIAFGPSSPVSFSSTGDKSLSSPLFVGSGTPVSIVTTGDFTNTANPGGIFRIQSLTVDVPGPLPLFGAASAFAYSRKLRSKVKSTNAINITHT